MPVPNVPKFTQAEYIERCIWFLDNMDVELVLEYRHASGDEKVRMLQRLINDPEDTSMALYDYDEELESVLAEFGAQTGPLQTVNLVLLKTYWKSRSLRALMVKAANEKKLIFDDTRYDLTDPDSEEWGVFCILKSQVDNHHTRGLDQLKKLSEATQRLMGKFISFSNGGEDVLKPSQGFFRESNDGVYLPFNGLTEEEGGELTGKPLTDDEWKELLAPLGHMYV